VQAVPHVQDDVHVCTPHPVAAPVLFMSQPPRVSPGVQPLSPLHPPNAPHAPHVQPAATSHVRMRVCVPEPQRPHGWVSLSIWPGVHTPEPPPMHVLQSENAPH
jgi:hypothetical protein